MHEHLPFLPVAPYSTAWFRLSDRSLISQATQIVQLEERKIVGRLGLSHCSQPSRIMLQHVTTLCACHGRLPSIGLFSDTKQAMGEGKSGPVETRLTGPVATALFYALTTEPLDPWQRSRSKSAYKSQARGLSRLQLSFFLSPSNTLPYCEWRSQVDRVVGLEWIDCTSTLPEQILSLSTTPASGSIISQCIVACSTISLECRHPWRQMYRNLCGFL